MGVNLFRDKGEGAIRAGCLSPTYEVLLSLIGPQLQRSGGLFLSVRWQSDVFQMLRRTFWRLRRSRKFRRIYRDVCASCASSAAFSETFAQAAQVPRHLLRRLRRLRKLRGICRDVCAGCASTTAFAETFAQAAQVARHLPRRLRRLRKFRRIYRGVCGSPASASKNFLVSAGVPQAFPKLLWPLPHAINDILYG